MRLNKDFIRYWLPVILCACFIYWMSTDTFSFQHTISVVDAIIRFLVPGLSTQKVYFIHSIVRKLGHVIEYFILGFLLLRALRSQARARWKWQWFLFTSIVVLLWAAGDEYHQSFVPTRTSSVLDVAIDTAGGILGQIVSTLLSRHRRG